LYKKLEKNYPSFLFQESSSNVRLQYSLSNWSEYGGKIKLDPCWYELERCAPDFFVKLTNFFWDELHIPPSLNFSKNDLLNKDNFGRRNIDSSSLFLFDVQPGINTPVKTVLPTSVRGIHLDNPLEIFALLIYFKDNEDNQGGNLEFWSCRDSSTLQRYGKSEYEGSFEQIGSLEYGSNVAAAFLNSPISFHSVSPRSQGNKVRKLVNIILELNPKYGKGWFDIPSTTAIKNSDGVRKIWKKFKQLLN
jgi:hypothetical protein